jgi:hypothetical protein
MWDRIRGSDLLRVEGSRGESEGGHDSDGEQRRDNGQRPAVPLRIEIFAVVNCPAHSLASTGSVYGCRRLSPIHQSGWHVEAESLEKSL